MMNIIDVKISDVRIIILQWRLLGWGQGDFLILKDWSIYHLYDSSSYLYNLQQLHCLDLYPHLYLSVSHGWTTLLDGNMATVASSLPLKKLLYGIVSIQQWLKYEVGLSTESPQVKFRAMSTCFHLGQHIRIFSPAAVWQLQSSVITLFFILHWICFLAP